MDSEYTPSPALVEAAAFLSSAPSLAKVSNATKLELYGLYKYLTVASVPHSSRPSLFDVTGRAKWDGWSNTGKKYVKRRADAEKRYLEVARGLGWAPGTVMTTTHAHDEGEVWDEDLGVNISRSDMGGGVGMGGSVSAMASSGGEETSGPSHTLHGCALGGNADGIAHVLGENALVDVDQRDEYGYTALHLACDRGNLAVVKVLIKHGADATIKDPDELTGTELARIAGHDDISTFLQTVLH